MRPMSSTGQIDLGLRWLATDSDSDIRNSAGGGWPAFLAAGEVLPRPRRLVLARLWPLWGIASGVGAFSGLLVWPDNSGVHILLFLAAFWLVPLLIMAWSVLSGLVLGRAPWWRLLITDPGDRVINSWFVRQSLAAQLLFVVSGIAWMWLMLATRQVIFYWGTSITAVSSRVDELFALLGLGLITSPSPDAVASAQAGAITGWEAALLADSYGWALWLTQVTALWPVLPLIALLAVNQWRLRIFLRNWPDHNHSLRMRYQQWSEPGVSYRALQPEQPVVEANGRQFPVLHRVKLQPGFYWQGASGRLLPEMSAVLGGGTFGEDSALVRARGSLLKHWYFDSDTVPTGDIADLVRLHLESGGQAHLHILAARAETASADLQHTWGTFLNRNRLDVPLDFIVAGNGEGAGGQR